MSYTVGCFCCTCGYEDGAPVRWDPACRNHGAHGLRGCVEHKREATNCDCGCGYKITDPDKAKHGAGTTMDEYSQIVEAAQHVLDNAGLDTGRGHAELKDALARLPDRTSDDR